MTTGFGIQALLRIISHLVFIIISFQTIRSLNVEMLFKKNHEREIQLFLVLLSIAIGYSVSNFFLEFISQSQSLRYLVHK